MYKIGGGGYKNEDMNKCNIIDSMILCIVSWQKISIKNTLLVTLHRLALKKNRRQKERVPVGI